MSSTGIIKSVNWHITSACNYQCKFCFTKNLRSDEVDRNRTEKILRILFDIGIEKINFVGGEPLIHPHIDSLTRMAKEIGYVVSLTTNGSLLTVKKLAQLRNHVDWIGLSVESCSDKIESRLGRGNGGHVTHCIQISDRIREAGIHLKINSTITRLNYSENLRPLIRTLNPERWKNFQYLPIMGQNLDSEDDLSITADQFQKFIQMHETLTMSNGETPVFETCNDMIGSYFMLNPSGNIIVNDYGGYSEILFETAIKLGIETIINPEKYLNRNAIYAWNSCKSQKKTSLDS